MVGHASIKHRLSLVAMSLVPVVFLALVACSGDDNATPTPTSSPEPVVQGSISGRLDIGPLCPVEPCTNPINPYSGLKAVVETADGEVILRMTVNENGTFSGMIQPGQYLVDIQPCDFLGCSSVLPVRVNVSGGQTAAMDIRIDTGIR